MPTSFGDHASRRLKQCYVHAMNETRPPQNQDHLAERAWVRAPGRVLGLGLITILRNLDASKLVRDRFFTLAKANWGTNGD
jgi:hypothetical protein